MTESPVIIRFSKQQAIRYSLLLLACLHSPFSLGKTNHENTQESVSFYGQRSAQPTLDPDIEKPKYIRRVIAPTIEPPEESAKPPSRTLPQNSPHQHRLAHSVVLRQANIGNQLDASNGPLINVDNHSLTPITFTPLSRNDKLLAKKAQYYLSRNLRKTTALWDSVQGYPHTTMWDVASGIAGTLALEALAMKSADQTHSEMDKLLDTLLRLPLYKGILPNREYATKTAKPSGKLSHTESNGNGWSALDIGRLLIWLKILSQVHPALEPKIEQLVGTWQLGHAIHNGTLFGMKLTRDKEHYRQEGRHGYLQYAAEGFRMFGYEVPLPALKQYLKPIDIDGHAIEIDTRNVPFLTSDPFILASIEYGLDPDWNQLHALYELHKVKSEQEQQLYAFAEDAMDKNPWFAYNSLYYYGKPWTSVSPSGKVIENQQIFSNKAAFGFSVLFDDAFSDNLYQTVLDHSVNFRAIPTGHYADKGSNSAFNINTNSLILVSLWFKHRSGMPIYQPELPVK